MYIVFNNIILFEYKIFILSDEAFNLEPLVHPRGRNISGCRMDQLSKFTTNIFAREIVFSLAYAVGRSLTVDMATNSKTELVVECI